MGCGGSKSIAPFPSHTRLQQNVSLHVQVSHARALEHPVSDVGSRELSHREPSSVQSRRFSMKLPLTVAEKNADPPVKSMTGWSTKHRRIESGPSTQRESKASKDFTIKEGHVGTQLVSRTRFKDSDSSIPNTKQVVTVSKTHSKVSNRATLDLDLTGQKTQHILLSSTPDLDHRVSLQTLLRDKSRLPERESASAGLDIPKDVRKQQQMGSGRRLWKCSSIDMQEISQTDEGPVGAKGEHVCNCPMCPQMSGVQHQKKLGKQLPIVEAREESIDSGAQLLGDSVNAGPQKWRYAVDKSDELDMLPGLDLEDSEIHGLRKASLEGMDSFASASRKRGFNSSATSREEQLKPLKTKPTTSKWADLCTSIREEGHESMVERSGLENSMFFHDPGEYSRFFDRFKSKFAKSKRLGVNILENIEESQASESNHKSKAHPNEVSGKAVKKRKRKLSESMRVVFKSSSTNKESTPRNSKKKNPVIVKKVSVPEAGLTHMDDHKKRIHHLEHEFLSNNPNKRSKTLKEAPFKPILQNEHHDKQRFSKDLPAIIEKADNVDSATNSPIANPPVVRSEADPKPSAFALKPVGEGNHTPNADVHVHRKQVLDTFSDLSQKSASERDVRRMRVDAVRSQQEISDTPNHPGIRSTKTARLDHIGDNKSLQIIKKSERSGGTGSTNKPDPSSKELTRGRSFPQEGEQTSPPVPTEINESARFGGEISPEKSNSKEPKLFHGNILDQPSPIEVPVGVRTQFKIKLQNPSLFGPGGVISQNNKSGSPASLNYTLTFQPEDPGNITKRSSVNRSFWTFEAGQKHLDMSEQKLATDSLVSPPKVMSERFADKPDAFQQINMLK